MEDTHGQVTADRLKVLESISAKPGCRRSDALGSPSSSASTTMAMATSTDENVKELLVPKHVSYIQSLDKASCKSLVDRSSTDLQCSARMILLTILLHTYVSAAYTGG